MIFRLYELHEKLNKIKRLESFNKVSEFILKKPLCTNIYKTFLSYNVGNYYHPYCPNFDYFEYLFDCDDCKREFSASLCHIVISGTWCKFCKNKTEKLLLTWLEKTFEQYKIITQSTFDWCVNDESGKKLPFDFCIKKLKLIIELDGKQHFEQVMNWTPYEFTQNRDIYKMIKALKNGYTVIRISQQDVWSKKYNLNNMKEYIKLHDYPRIIYLSVNENLYKFHKHLMFIVFVNSNLEYKFSKSISDKIVKYLRI